MAVWVNYHAAGRHCNRPGRSTLLPNTIIIIKNGEGLRIFEHTFIFISLYGDLFYICVLKVKPSDLYCFIISLFKEQAERIKIL